MARLCDFGFGHVDLWRSDEMQLVQLMIPAEAAHDTIAALGDLAILQFKDLNTEKSAFQRTFANQVKRFDEMARRLRYLTDQVGKGGLAVLGQGFGSKPLPVDELESKLEDMEKELLEINSNGEKLQRTYHELLEYQLVLEKAGAFFDKARSDAAVETQARPDASGEGVSAPLLESGAGYGAGFKLGFVAGLIAFDKVLAFERMLFRATRGNMFLKHVPVGAVRDPASGELVSKSVFVVFYSGDRAKIKVTKICEAFGASRYPFSEDAAAQRKTYSELSARIREMNTTLELGANHKATTLQFLASNLDSWTTIARREKAIYHTMNKLSVDVTSKVMVAEAWVPVAQRARLHETLRMVAETGSTQVNTIVQPLVTHDEAPTYFRTTKFTECFQAIVEAYGVARYREANPTVFTIMTFPFLFAVMFGDFGHGFLMLFFALWLVMSEKKYMNQNLSDMFGMAFGGRYCVLLMSLFSIYIGAIYNEWFSMPMSWVGTSGWICTQGRVTAEYDLRDCVAEGGEVEFSGKPYPFGIDPMWHGTKTELPFLNSVKMKMSILLGVIHMNLGIICSLFNNLHFRDSLSTWCEFVPQMIFLNGLFGYLCFLIVFKWITGSLADLYHVMIYMFLAPGTVDKAGFLFPGQDKVQVWLLLVALIAVPCMLFPKPLILNARAKKASQGHDSYTVLSGHDAEAGTSHQAAPSHGGGGHGHGEEFDFGEVFVHQMIHTIEFVLGAVSNTASYLRLWALSLAHSQLSAVFYDRVLIMTITIGHPAVIFVGFFVFCCATLGVLMVMESLSAFLHALRLHWVEYMNKFYRGDGYSFTPLDLTILHKEE